MKSWTQYSRCQLLELQSQVQGEYDQLKLAKLNLDMTRGKPSAAQLDLSMAMLTITDKTPTATPFYMAEGGIDCRNYGGLDGLNEAKELFAPMLDCQASQMLIGGNASLALMHDAIWRAMTFGVPGGTRPWSQEAKIKFLCPVPGYDRHFSILEHFGIEMIAVNLDDHGPDLEMVARLCRDDPSIKGIFCVPKYANPSGVSYSDQVVDALASMSAAPDFRIFWDNAYSIHHLGDGATALKSILSACASHGHPDRALVFASTSKITFAGGGICFLASSSPNLNEIKSHLKYQTIGPDKLNILRHTRFFGSYDHLLAHMDRHAAILKPKFDAVQQAFDQHLCGKDILKWTRPKGGYFISIDTIPGCAQQTVALAAAIGVKLTEAGATFPMAHDPNDSNIRIAPSMPPLAEVKQAMDAVVICIKLATLQRMTMAENAPRG